MRKFVKQEIREILQTLDEAQQSFDTFLNQRDAEGIMELLANCQETAIQVGNIIEESEGEELKTILLLEEYCEFLYEISTQSMEKMDRIAIKKKWNKQLSTIKKSVEKDIRVTLEIVFCPYKASMWDSLESIWRAARDDENCNAYVVPIPYYDRNPDFSFGQMHYEVLEYPESVPVVSYQKYDFAKRKPDIIYVHNPYDMGNYVTSVEPAFYSHELKKYTEMLVYVPYFIAGYYANKQSAANHVPPCINQVDLCIVQSENQKKALSVTKQNAEKLLVMGSPKIDKIRNFQTDKRLSFLLKDKVKGKKVILVNSSISRILSDNEWSENMCRLIQNFRNAENLFLIWRPHPLLLETIEAMRPSEKIKVQAVFNQIDRMENAYIDRCPSADGAIAISDGMISDYSSLVLQYTATGKPALLTTGSAKYRETKIVCGDYFSNYFVQDGTSVEEFCNKIVNGEDEKKEERIEYFNNSIANTDGTCGLKIHNYVKNLVE